MAVQQLLETQLQQQTPLLQQLQQQQQQPQLLVLLQPLLRALVLKPQLLVQQQQHQVLDRLHGLICGSCQSVVPARYSLQKCGKKMKIRQYVIATHGDIIQIILTFGIILTVRILA